MDNGNAGKESAVAYFVYFCMWILKQRLRGSRYDSHAQAGVRPADGGPGIVIEAEIGGGKSFPGKSVVQGCLPSAVYDQRQAAQGLQSNAAVKTAGINSNLMRQT